MSVNGNRRYGPRTTPATPKASRGSEKMAMSTSRVLDLRTHCSWIHGVRAWSLNSRSVRIAYGKPHVTYTLVSSLRERAHPV